MSDLDVNAPYLISVIMIEKGTTTYEWESPKWILKPIDVDFWWEGVAGGMSK